MVVGKKVCLIAGGAGFIGKSLAARILAEGHAVLCLDNFSTSDPYSLGDLRRHEHFTVIKHDVVVPIDLTVDEIYNLACPASPTHYQRDPIKTIKTSVLGAINLLDLAQRTGARIVQASTSEVYGDPQCHPQSESYWGWVNPIGPRACYDEGKRCAETLFVESRSRHDVDAHIARIFNTYGPGMALDDGRVVSNFIVQALTGKALTVHGDGSQTRSFCHVSDTARGLTRLMQEGPGGGAPINLGNPREASVLELAKMILDMTGSRSALRRLPLPQDDPVRRRPDIARAQSLLDWTPEIGLREGLMDTIRYFETELSRNARLGALAAGL